MGVLWGRVCSNVAEGRAGRAPPALWVGCPYAHVKAGYCLGQLQLTAVTSS